MSGVPGFFRLVNYSCRATARNNLPLPGLQFRHQGVEPESEPLRLFSIQKFYFPNELWVANSIPCTIHQVYICACKSASHILTVTCFTLCLSSLRLTGLSRLQLTPLEEASTVHARPLCKSLHPSPYQQLPGTLGTYPQTLMVS